MRALGVLADGLERDLPSPSHVLDEMPQEPPQQQCVGALLTSKPLVGALVHLLFSPRHQLHIIRRTSVDFRCHTLSSSSEVATKETIISTARKPP